MRKAVKGNVSWVGYLGWELEKFHGDDYSIKNGSSQNAYLIGKQADADAARTETGKAPSGCELAATGGALL